MVAVVWGDTARRAGGRRAPCVVRGPVRDLVWGLVWGLGRAEARRGVGEGVWCERRKLNPH